MAALLRQDRFQYVCFSCKIGFHSWQSYRKHIVYLNNHCQPDECRFCSRRFAAKGSRENHEDLHYAGKIAYECTEPGCGYQYRWGGDLNKHYRLYHGLRVGRYASQPALVRATAEPLDAFGLAPPLAPAPFVPSRLESRPHVCSVCPRRFYSTQGLENHQRSHPRVIAYECNEDRCGKVYLSRRQLDDHKREAHGQLPPPLKPFDFTGLVLVPGSMAAPPTDIASGSEAAPSTGIAADPLIATDPVVDPTIVIASEPMVASAPASDSNN